MAILLQASKSAASVGGAAVTTAAIDTTTSGGASLIVVAISDYVSDSSTLSDSAGNTWTALTAHQDSGANVRNQIYYVTSPTTSASHTFKATPATSSFASIMVMSFTGTQLSSPFDAQNGAGGATATTQQPGSITPAANGELIVSGWGGDSDFSALTIDSSFTIPTGMTQLFSNSNNFGGSFAYFVQSSSAAINPTWSWTTAIDPVATIASFKAAPAGDTLMGQADT